MAFTRSLRSALRCVGCWLAHSPITSPCQRRLRNTGTLVTAHLLRTRSMHCLCQRVSAERHSTCIGSARLTRRLRGRISVCASTSAVLQRCPLQLVFFASASAAGATTQSVGMDIVHDDGPEEEDPLDAYMRSIEGEVVQQQASTTTAADDIVNPHVQPQRSTLATATSLLPLGLVEEHSNGRAAVFQQRQPPPSAAQLAVARKVAASRFCDVLTERRRSTRAPQTQRHREASDNASSNDEVDGRKHDDSDRVESAGGAVVTGEVQDVCLSLLLAQPAEFLR